MTRTVTNLGDTYRDIVSGFEGVCTGKAQYLTGCDQSVLKPRTLTKDGEPRDGRWFDDTQLEIVPMTTRLTLDTSPLPSTNRRFGGPNRDTPGKQGGI